MCTMVRVEEGATIQEIVRNIHQKKVYSLFVEGGKS